MLQNLKSEKSRYLKALLSLYVPSFSPASLLFLSSVLSYFLSLPISFPFALSPLSLQLLSQFPCVLLLPLPISLYLTLLLSFPLCASSYSLDSPPHPSPFSLNWISWSSFFVCSFNLMLYLFLNLYALLVSSYLPDVWSSQINSNNLCIWESFSKGKGWMAVSSSDVEDSLKGTINMELINPVLDNILLQEVKFGISSLGDSHYETKAWEFSQQEDRGISRHKKCLIYPHYRKHMGNSHYIKTCESRWLPVKYHILFTSPLL